MRSEHKDKKLSDDGFDAIAAVILISVFVGGLVFWLNGFPG